MRGNFILLLFMGALVPSVYCQDSDYPWAWDCRNEVVEANENATLEDRCVRVMKSENINATGINTCKLTCGPNGVLWPRPTSVELGKDVNFFIPDNIRIYTGVCPANVRILLDVAYQIFSDNIAHYTPDSITWNTTYTHEVNIAVQVTDNQEHLNYDTDESYTLRIISTEDDTAVTIHAETFFGARHGLETLSQLIDYDDEHETLQIVSDVVITDYPVFKHRGISLDTSRNYIGIPSIERTIDGMASNKLNILHWHITDSHSFPLEVKSRPKMMQYGAYSPSQVYRESEVAELIKYAQVRGVHILPEFDAPAHVGNGFQWGEEDGLGKLTVCVEQEPWQSVCVEPPCGQLNLANEKMYDVLSDIYKDMVDMFQPMHVFHYGGDEINLACWNETEEIIEWMEGKNSSRDADDYYREWSNFQERARELLVNASKEVDAESSVGEFGILWTSHLTEEDNVKKYLNPDEYIIQIWTDNKSNIIKEVLEAGFRIIFSNYDAWYLDCGFGAWVGAGPPNINWCSPYKGWQTVYDNSPHHVAKDLTGETHEDKIFGGEVAMWTEQTDEMALDSRLWPRSAAFGERMWSNPSESWRLAETRMVHQRKRLVQRGIHADRLQPEWCHQNEGLCYAYPAEDINPELTTSPSVTTDGGSNLATMFVLNVVAIMFIALNYKVFSG